MIGWGARRSVPSGFIRSFAQQYGIDVSEADRPLAEYSGLQEFFTRRLRPGARPFDEKLDAVLSPADGTVVESGFASGGDTIEVKQTSFSLPELVADVDLARTLEGGPFLVTYLSPRDYHRVHAPVAGEVIAWSHVPGRLFPVNDRSVKREPGLFSRNERFVTTMATEVGLCVVVMVAAVGVGHITATYDPEVATHAGGFSSGVSRHKRFERPVRLDRGQELGIFNLGSTTIVIFEPRRVELHPQSPGSATRMGAAIGRMMGRAADGKVGA